VPQNFFQTVRVEPEPEDVSKLEQTKSKSPDSDGFLDEDDEIEHNRAISESNSVFADVGPAEQDLPSSEGPVDIQVPDGYVVVGTESSDGPVKGLEDESDGDHKDISKNRINGDPWVRFPRVGQH
jgi:hypothetical protein